MDAAHYRKIELQTPADLTYLKTNAVSLSRQKLDLHLPPSAASSDPDPMRERVRELVDTFITKTFNSAAPSISINGLDPSPTDLTENENESQTRETIEYEPYDTRLASRVTSLYAQLESLTTTVAQLRRDAPGKAAGGYADALRGVLEEDDADFGAGAGAGAGAGEGEVDVEMDGGDSHSHSYSHGDSHPDWNLDITPGKTDVEISRWRDGDVATSYDDALRLLLRLQGEAGTAADTDADADEDDGLALATTVGKAERASRAAEVVERM